MNLVDKEIVIVGSGFAGLGMAIRLKKKGQHDFTILEQADDLGGTWRDNTYPEAACDIPSHVYSFSFAPKPDWSRQFSGQAEIYAYMQHCADSFQLRSHIRFSTKVEKARFDERGGVWILALSGGQTLRARYLILCTGGLSRPAYPNIQGLSSFQGKIFHTARWDHNFKLEGQRVAIIGTGASSIQIVPAIAPKVAELHVFQRTAAWILPKADRVFSQKERQLLSRVPGLQRLMRTGLYWLYELRAMALLRPSLMRIGQKRAFAHMDEKISDPQLKARLTPEYTMGCKRILLSNDFYDAFKLPQTHLVSEGIAEVTPQGIKTQDQQEIKLDAIICATGFQVAEATAPFEIRGRGNQELSALWANGAEAYLGSSVAGFPNMFMIVGPNTGLGHNSMIFMIEAQSRYVVDGILKAGQAKLKSIEVKKDVQASYNSELSRRFKNTVWTSGGCKSWYLAPNGRNTTIWPGFTFEFAFRTRKFQMSAYDFEESTAPSAERQLA